MQKKVLLIVLLLPFVVLQKVNAQIEVDLADAKAKPQEIDLTTESFIIINRMKDVTYKHVWKRKKNVPTLPFDVPAITSGGTASDEDKKKCEEATKLIAEVNAAKDEAGVKTAVTKANQLLGTMADGDCKNLLKKRVDLTQDPINFPYAGKLGYNETITLTITRVGLDGKQIGNPLTYTFTTEERSRWLTHFGLTYAPSVIVKSPKYYSKADTSVANRYTITKQNNNGQKPWDNISATINFTYPLSVDPKGLDFGFTGGFGLNPDFQLSGHVGISAIIGTNIIIGSGIVFMQKYNLKGEYSNGQVIRENLSFESLHEKVWKPELFFTIGFRFNKNPFAGSSEKKEASADKKPAANGNSQQ